MNAKARAFATLLAASIGLAASGPAQAEERCQLVRAASLDLHLDSSGRVNVPYAESLEVSAGTAPFSWTPTPASPPLPPGLTLSSTGVISGTPTTVGSYTFVVTVTDAASRISTRTISITITR